VLVRGVGGIRCGVHACAIVAAHVGWRWRGGRWCIHNVLLLGLGGLGLLGLLGLLVVVEVVVVVEGLLLLLLLLL
jgi:hypothetical protein